jgi:Fe-S-cluster containining protein
MQPQILDESVRFACSSCTFCCDQPWRTLIEADKARALDGHDFGAYPQLAGKTFYHKSEDDGEGLYRLGKGQGTRCLFLDTDGLCIIHKELGAEAKPNMCRQFPFLAAHTWVDDRVSANYGCPSIQEATGLPLADHAEDISAVVPRAQRDPRPDTPVPLEARCTVTPEQNRALLARAVSLFDVERGGDVWSRFAELLALLVAVRDYRKTKSGQDGELVDLLVSGQELPGTPEVPEILAHPRAAQSPMGARLLFAATLYPDTIPADAVKKMGLLKRLTLVPKLMSLATLTGAYSSRLLGRNLVIDQVMAYETAREPDPRATRLLLRYYRSRLWQRYLCGTRLNIMAGVHQHIQDLNAIVFLARADAAQQGVPQLTEPIIRKAMTLVEFHLSNQERLFNQAVKGWFRSQLQSPALAVASLRLMALKRPPATAAADDGEQVATARS